MPLDTNALSAWAEGERAIEPVFRSASMSIIPVIVSGEFDFGIRLPKHYRRHADWLDANLASVEVVSIDQAVAARFSAVAAFPTPRGPSIATAGGEAVRMD